MTSFRFFHAADIHLDSPLVGLAGIDGGVAERIRSAPRVAFEALVERAIEDQIDFFVIAGDLYDGDWRDYKTGLFFAEQMGRLKQKEIPVFVLHGNHDAESQITKSLTLPDNVKVFSSQKPETFQFEKIDVVLHGHSYLERAVFDNLVPGYPPPVKNAFNIGVLHTALGHEGSVHANYAPCSLAELVAKGYEYWALGHVHQPQVLHEQPHVIFPGNLQGRHVKETGAKGAYLVTVEEGQIVEVSFQEFDVVRWEVLNVDVEAACNIADVIEQMRQALSQGVAAANGRLLSARLVLQGQTGFHSRLVRDLDYLIEEARSLALGMGYEVAWVERVVVETKPMVDAITQAEKLEALGDLKHLLNEAVDDEDLIRQLKSDIGQLIAKLPSDLRDKPDDEVLAKAVNDNYAALVQQVTPYLCDRLIAEDE